MRMLFVGILGFLVVALNGRAGGQTLEEAGRRAFFETSVRPILAKHCISCHGGEKTKGGLVLTSRAGILGGGAHGAAVSLEKPGESLLLKAVRWEDDDLLMPPKEKLGAGEIATLAKWIEMGLPYVGDTAAVKPAEHAKRPTIDPATFWSFQAVKRPAVPNVKDRAWVRNEIDSFVLSRLEEKGIKPVVAASKVALLRRAFFDLIGLPPTPEDVSAYLTDESANAFEKVIDRLLASPHYGEKWGRHWLDLVRFAETNSFERDAAKPNAWRYRDWVIEALNSDMGYDEFIRQQLAGDEMARPTPQSITATGFYRLGAWDDEPTDRLQARYDELDDIVTTTGQVFMGLTINCARCHDHKIDPIPQKDYYRLMAFFHNIAPYQTKGPNILTPIAPGDQVKAREQEGLAIEQRREDLRKRIEHFEKLVMKELKSEEREKIKSRRKREEVFAPYVLKATNEDELRHYREYWAQLRELEAHKVTDLPEALSVKETGAVAGPTHVLIRGSAASKGAEVGPGFPGVLGGKDAMVGKPAAGAKTSGRRTALANWLTDAGNPLTARVMANRLWQHHFGRGIVKSPNDFGFAGERPTHPELLDWLASELVSGGWKLKRMHKLMMMSSAYRMSSTATEEGMAKDPGNELMWRFDMRRLAAEEIRDAMLAVNGTINLAVGGPSVYPEIPKEVLAGQSRPGEGWGRSSAAEQARRSVYVFVKRSLSVPMMAAFDTPDVDFSCPARFATTQAPQSLLMLNSEEMGRQAKALAARLRREAGDSVEKQVELALKLATARGPTGEEVERGVLFMKRLRERHGVSGEVALEQFALMVLNLNEFVYLD